jgi:serine/threonine-protein phosphatase 2A activator
MTCVKEIKTDDDLKYFQTTCPGYALILPRLERICLLAKGKVGVSPLMSPIIANIVSLLESIENGLSLFPPIEQPMRFGNKAFRQFHEWLVSSSDGLLRSCLPESIPPPLINELQTYLDDSFGNPVRIDFGTGHELAFLAFIITLLESDHLDECDSIPLIVFKKYFSVVRAITTLYQMEPAGSHGVWGLDDFHHLPFLIGAAQLIAHEKDVGVPSDVLRDCDDEATPSNMFYDNIAFIKQSKCKHAPFREVAPILCDITSRSENWTIVCYKLMQMYKTEVLGKWPIVQHFYFGKYIPWK